MNTDTLAYSVAMYILTSYLMFQMLYVSNYASTIKPFLIGQENTAVCSKLQSISAFSRDYLWLAFGAPNANGILDSLYFKAMLV